MTTSTTTTITTTIRTTTTTTAPVEPWLKKLMEKLPQFPNCGVEAELSIFSGTLVEIGELPWTVLIEYEKGELFKH